ncbi:hypothetical protein BJY04DRAFT_189928 [Aspergillus karnatakaensis]|uniref:uncharacterized protein n=1 Tax=Aspergillus karnatakaensis TaxID=1810916 RepID=UPI003CCCCA01
MRASRAKRSDRPATDYERWLNDDNPPADSAPQFEPREGDHIRTHRAAHQSISKASIDTMDYQTQLAASAAPREGTHQITSWPRVPDIITFYGALIILFLLLRYFVVNLMRQMRGRRVDVDHAVRHPRQISTNTVEEHELKKV